MPANLSNIPEPGQIVTVRQRRYVVAEVQKSALPSTPLSAKLETGQYFVRLNSIEDDALTLQVAATYDWGDLDLGHGFHETAQEMRFTISEEARQEVPDSLLRLNHKMYEEGVRMGLHEKKGNAKGEKKAKDMKKKPEGQMELF